MLLKGSNTNARGVHRIAVIGAGPAGIAAATAAAALGIEVDWFDKENRPGGKLRDYHQLFPDRDFAESVIGGIDSSDSAITIKKHFGTEVKGILAADGRFRLEYGDQESESYDSVILAKGFDFFDARRKEEFGYGMYDRVITSADLEKILRSEPERLSPGGVAPSSLAFVHCVGSRDEQAGISYCSRLCCITGIKQAVEMREMFPDSRVYNFYIDLRAFGTGYEELYREAQEKYQVQFIRGRVSEASENLDKRIVLKAEDTLMGRPLKVTVDWLVLLVGMVPSCTQVDVDHQACTDATTGFYRSANPLTGHGLQGHPGIFTAGASTGPVSIPEAVASGRAAVMEVWQYLNNR